MRNQSEESILEESILNGVDVSEEEIKKITERYKLTNEDLAELITKFEKFQMENWTNDIAQIYANYEVANYLQQNLEVVNKENSNLLNNILNYFFDNLLKVMNKVDDFDTWEIQNKIPAIFRVIELISDIESCQITKTDCADFIKESCAQVETINSNRASYQIREFFKGYYGFVDDLTKTPEIANQEIETLEPEKSSVSNPEVTTSNTRLRLLKKLQNRNPEDARKTQDSKNPNQAKPDLTAEEIEEIARQLGDKKPKTKSEKKTKAKTPQPANPPIETPNPIKPDLESKPTTRSRILKTTTHEATHDDGTGWEIVGEKKTKKPIASPSEKTQNTGTNQGLQSRVKVSSTTKTINPAKNNPSPTQTETKETITFSTSKSPEKTIADYPNSTSNAVLSKSPEEIIAELKKLIAREEAISKTGASLSDLAALSLSSPNPPSTTSSKTISTKQKEGLNLSSTEEFPSITPRKVTTPRGEASQLSHVQQKQK